jgi:DNA modification methylase
LVLDPFLGSGSTLIAAEETGRTCIGVELDAHYVEVAIRRWQRATGQNAVHLETGETFDSFTTRMEEEENKAWFQIVKRNLEGLDTDDGTSGEEPA